MKKNCFLFLILFLSLCFLLCCGNEDELIQNPSSLEKYTISEEDIKFNSNIDTNDLLIKDESSLVLTSFKELKVQSFNEDFQEEWCFESELQGTLRANQMTNHLEGIIIIGDVAVQDLFISKIDASGNNKFTYRFEDDQQTIGYTLVSNSFGEIVFAGSRFVPPSNNTKEIIFGKLDLNGELLWLKTYTNDNSEKPLKIVINQNQDYSLLFAGNPLFDKIGILTFDDEGEILDQKDLPIFYEGGRGYDFIPTSDGGHLIAISTGDSFEPILVSLIKLNSDFDLEWESKVGGTTANHYASQLIETNDNGFIFCGDVFSNGSIAEIYLAKVNMIGETIWERQFKHGDYIIGKSVQELNDGSLTILGGTLENSFALFKTDSEGRPK